MSLEIIPIARSLMNQERSLRKSIMNKNYKKYNEIINHMHNTIRSYNYDNDYQSNVIYHDIAHKSISLYVNWLDPFRHEVWPHMTKKDIAHILNIFLRKYLCKVFCFDVANEIISFYYHDMRSDTMYGRKMKLLT